VHDIVYHMGWVDVRRVCRGQRIGEVGGALRARSGNVNPLKLWCVPLQIALKGMPRGPCRQPRLNPSLGLADHGFSTNIVGAS
jgi:hypothetical protein